MKTEYHQDACEYCGKDATIFTLFLSGERVSICSSGECKEKHQKLLDRENADFEEAGLI